MNYAFAMYRLGNQLGSIFSPAKTIEKAGTMFLTPKRQEIKEWEQQAEQVGQRFKLSEEISAIRWLPAKKNEQEGVRKQILLVHGWESRATQMYGIAKSLLKQGFEVVAVDMPAHGHSSGTTSNPRVFTQTIQLAQQQLGDFEAIIGHSMGAGATAFAVGQGVSPQKIVLISGPSSIENALRRFAGFIGLNKKGVNRFVQFVSNFVGGTLEELDSALLLKKSNISALLIHDEQDMEVPASESKRLAQSLKNSELYLSHGLGHRKILKSEAVLQKITEFIT